MLPPVQVLPGLFVGNLEDAKDAAQLDLHAISHVVACYDNARRVFKVAMPGVAGRVGLAEWIYDCLICQD